MEFGTALGYPFDDSQAGTKLPAGFVISMVPILNWGFSGYCAEIIANVAKDDAHPLPNWDRFGEFFLTGATLWLGQLPYGLPNLIFGLALIAISWNAGADETVLGFRAPFLLPNAVVIPLACISGLLGLVASFVWTAAYIRFSTGGRSLSELWEISENFRFLTANFRDLLVASIASGVYAFVSGFVLSAVIGFCGLTANNYETFVSGVISQILNGAIGFLPTLFYVHLLGQIGLKTRLAAITRALEFPQGPAV